MRYNFPLSPYNQQRQHQKPVWTYPAHLAMYATYLRDKGHDIHWDERPVRRFVGEPWVENDCQIDVEFNMLPFPDRVLTDAKNKRWQTNGNYKYHPATHMMVSNLCWYRKCSFCVESRCSKTRHVRPVSHVMEEIDDCMRLGFREIFDDSGTIPTGTWLHGLCEAIIKRRKKIVLGCNLRLMHEDFALMKQAGFRMILVGVESANQRTLNYINKGTKVEDIIPVFQHMSSAGLEPHATVMFGYPWEDHHEAMRTVKLVHFLLKKGYAKTAQASVYMPPKTAPDSTPFQKYIKKVYDVYKHPMYWSRKLRDIRSLEDFMYILKRIDHLWKAK